MEEDDSEDLADILRRFEESAERVRVQRTAPRPSRSSRRRWLVAIAAGAAVVASSVGISSGGGDQAQTQALASELRIGDERRQPIGIESNQPRQRWPSKSGIAKAELLAKDRAGVISFAAIGPGDRVVGFDENRRFVCASVVKAMLLVAELRRLESQDLPIDSGTAGTLKAMITYSDNDAANVIYGRVGDAGLYEVAKLAGMTNFDVYGYWANAQITAGDMAGFADRIDRLLDLPGGGYASQLLQSIIPAQSWGVPQVAPKGSTVRFKGGWRPTDSGELVHQVARVDAGKRSYSLAILTDGNPSMDHGAQTIRLIAAEILKGAEASN